MNRIFYDSVVFTSIQKLCATVRLWPNSLESIEVLYIHVRTDITKKQKKKRNVKFVLNLIISPIGLFVKIIILNRNGATIWCLSQQYMWLNCVLLQHCIPKIETVTKKRNKAVYLKQTKTFLYHYYNRCQFSSFNNMILYIFNTFSLNLIFWRSMIPCIIDIYKYQSKYRIK